MAELGPKRGQNGSQNGSQKRSKMPLGAQEAPRGCQGAMLDQFWSQLGSIPTRFGGCFLYNVGLFANRRTCILVQLQAVLFYFYFRHAVCEAGFGGECGMQVCGTASSSIAKQRSGKAALGRPLARMHQLDYIIAGASASASGATTKYVVRKYYCSTGNG